MDPALLQQAETVSAQDMPGWRPGIFSTGIVSGKGRQKKGQHGAAPFFGCSNGNA